MKQLETALRKLIQEHVNMNGLKAWNQLDALLADVEVAYWLAALDVHRKAFPAVKEKDLCRGGGMRRR